MATTPEEGMATLLRNLEAKTGKSVDAWVTIARETGLSKHGQIMAILKQSHGLSHAHANQIALRALATIDAPAAGESDLIAAQYAGAKAKLLPIYEAIASAVRGFGSDVEFSPKKAYVSLRRSKQFAMIQPSTTSRLDVGLILKGVEPTDRLELSGSFNAMFTHRVRIGTVGEVDSQVLAWIKKAYLEA